LLQLGFVLGNRGRTLKQVAYLQARLLSVDLLRVLAILLMIQGHTADVLLSPAYRHGVAFDVWLFLRGLTAPVFFLLSGLSFAVSTTRHWGSNSGPSRKQVRRIGKFFFLILLGYALRLPARSMEGFESLDAAGWQSWLQVDVLQCVGATLGFLQLLALVLRRRVVFGGLACGLCASVILLAPVVWSSDWSTRLPLGMAAFLDSKTGSPFPLFPWSGYILFGAAAGFLRVRELLSGRLEILKTAKLGFLLLLAGLLFASLPSVYCGVDFWKTSPNLFLIRTGCAWLFLAMTTWTSDQWRFPRDALCTLSRESLVIYVVHVCVLYGSGWNNGLRHFIGPTRGLGATAGLSAGMILSMVALAFTWHRLKTARLFGRLGEAAATTFADSRRITDRAGIGNQPSASRRPGSG
jgi:uncharacterized membrane protein